MGKQPQEYEISYEVNLQFINKVREDIQRDPKTQGIEIIPRVDDSSIFAVNEEENVLLSFSS